MSRSDLERLVGALRGHVTEDKDKPNEEKDKLNEHDRMSLLDKADEVFHWLHNNKSAEGHHYAQKLKEMEMLVTPIKSVAKAVWRS